MSALVCLSYDDALPVHHEVVAHPLAEALVWDTRLRPGRQGGVLFQYAQKFNTRYATFGFNDTAHLDDGELWSVAYALRKMTTVEEAKIEALVKKR